MKSYTNVSKPKPKKKAIGYALKKTPGEVVQKGKPSQVNMSVEREKVKKTYTPGTTETGDPRYGDQGGGTNKEMNKLIADARAKKQDVTAPSSKGLIYKAGTTTEERTPTKLTTTLKVTPEIRKVNIEKVPLYERGKTAKLKKMSITAGGSDRGGNPANKSGIGGKKKIKIKKIKSFPKN